MIIGNVLISLSLAAALAACYYYYLTFRGQQAVLKYARWATGGLSLFVILAGLYLLALILSDQFQYEYIWANSSSTLPFFYKFASFWGGQEGSILLWLCFGVLYALVMSILFRRDKDSAFEAPTMLVASAIQLFPLVMLMVKSPFSVIPDVPFEGRGLNPLLQDPYMVIHPPLLFLGFAGLQSAYAFAVAALMRRDFSNWVHRAWPWTLVGWGFLGLGLSVGGFWAYRVLGWGGYWGWDPVENSSLVPWLLGSALVHGMITQKTRGRLVRWTLFMAMATYVSILYSTFLTRSGVLADFSVHTFGESPLMPIMVAAILAFAGWGLLLFMQRYREMSPGPDVFKTFLSRDFTSLVGVVAFIFAAVAVAIGTSSPLITGAIAGAGFLCGDNGLLLSLGARVCQQSNVAISYYNTISVPLGFVLAAFMMIAPVLAWQESRPGKVLELLKWPFIASLVASILAAILMMREPFSLFAVFLAIMALGTNALMVWKLYRANIWKIGGYLAHVGAALAIVGIIGTNVYKQVQQVAIFQGQSVEALGYSFSFQGLEQMPDEKWAMQIVVRRGNEAFIALPKLLPTDMGIVRNPHIHKYWSEDLYISPGDYDPGKSAGTLLELGRGQAKEAEGYSFKFNGFTRMGHDGQSAAAISMGAILEVSKAGAAPTTITPTLTVDPQKGTVQTPVVLPGTTLEVALDTAQIETGSVVISLMDTAKPVGATPPFVTLEISREPGINLLWAGLIIIAVGTGVAVVRRRYESTRAFLMEEPVLPVAEPQPKKEKRRQRQPAPKTRGATQPSRATRTR